MRFFLVLFLTVLSSGSTLSRAAEKPELVIYAYDSFLAQGGLGPEILPIFEKTCACRVRALPSGDGGQLLSRLKIDSERGKPTAQVVVGLDQHLWEQARGLIEPWDRWRPRGYEKIPRDLQVEEGFLPWDYGVFALMADRKLLREQKLDAPRSLHDLSRAALKRKFILEDPRTSTPGLAFVLFAHQAIGAAGVVEFWKSLRGQWLTLAPGWDSAYGLFLKGEAPLVWSYVTSQAYHREHGDSEGRYEAVLFEEGQPIQIEGAALVKGAVGSPEKLKLARDFLEFLISRAVQERVPRKNWMYPVVQGTRLPPSFEALPKSRKLLRTPRQAEAVKTALAQWSRAVEGEAR